MLNQLIICGRISEMGDKNIKVAVPRSYKNEDGVYDTDFIEISLTDNLYDNLINYCQKGDIVGVKGRVETRDNNMIVVAEKLTFLSSHKNKEQTEETEEYI